MTPSRRWLGIATPSWLKQSGTPQRAAGGRPLTACPGTPREKGRQCGRAQGRPAASLVLAQPQARAAGHSGRICTCVPGRSRAPGSW